MCMYKEISRSEGLFSGCECWLEINLQVLDWVQSSTWAGYYNYTNLQANLNMRQILI